MGFGQFINALPEAKNPDVLERVRLGRIRIQAVLDRETVAHTKTLEQKISEQGPRPQRVDPHLVGYAIKDLLELNRLKRHTHPSTGSKPWYSNIGAKDEVVQPRLDELAPLYDSVSGHGFGNLVGDALEIAVFRCLARIAQANPRYAYQGAFQLDQPKNAQGRFVKIQPPKNIGPNTTQKEADFLVFGYDAGPLCVECKNYREWLYPHHQNIKDLIIKAHNLRAIPVLINRRIHYTTKTNFLEPAGIIAHETYYQYYPSDHAELAEKVRHRRSLGFTDVMATEEPQPRTMKFFAETLPKIVDRMASQWESNKDALLDYATDTINLAQLYTEIDSPAGGKWVNFDEQDSEMPF